MKNQIITVYEINSEIAGNMLTDDKELLLKVVKKQSRFIGTKLSFSSYQMSKRDYDNLPDSRKKL